MERQELNRMFDHLAPTAEQERQGLHRLLQTERTVTPMKSDDGGIHQITLYPVELIDPAQVVSFSLFGQTFDLK